MRRGTVSNWDPGDTLVIGSLVDPPQVLPGGVSVGTNETAADGGVSSFPLRRAMAWDAFSGKPECVNDMSEFLEELDDNPRLRSSANLRTLSRVRQELERIPESASLSDPIELRLQDVLVLMNQLMARMR